MKAPMNAASRSVPVVLIALAAVSLGACGQKGPLYLPEQARDIVTRPAQTPAPPAEEKAEEKSEDEDSPNKDTTSPE